MTTTSKVALITGAGSGIGKALALAFLHQGYSVVLAGRRADALEAVVKASASSQALEVATDVSNQWPHCLPKSRIPLAAWM